MWSHPFFQKVAFWRPILGKRLGKKFGLKKMRCGVVWGGEGRWINELLYKTSLLFHLGGTRRCERVNTCFTVTLVKKYSLP